MKKRLSKWQKARRYFEETHPKYYRNYKKKYHKKIRDFIIKLKHNKRCMDCHKVYPHYVLDFDHVRGKKREQISQLMHKVSLSTVQTEITKCDLVCANCHRTRTWKRKQHETYVSN